MDKRKARKIWILNGKGRELPEVFDRLEEYEFLSLSGDEPNPSETPSAVIVLIEQPGDLEIAEGFGRSPAGREIPLLLFLSREMENTLETLPSHQGILPSCSGPLLVRENLKILLRAECEEREEENAVNRQSPSREYTATLESIPIGIIVHGADTSIIYNNPASETILGLSRQQIMGKKVRDPQWKFVDEQQKILSPDEYPVSLVMVSKETLKNRIYGIIRPDRNYVTWVMVNALPILEDSGSVLKVIVNFYDITEYKRLQDEISHSRKMEAVSQLAGGVAHDFNNMLTGIMSSADLLKNTVNRESLDNTYLDIILQSAQRAADLNGKLLSFARKGKSVSSPVNIHTLLSGLIKEISGNLDKRIHINSTRKARHHTVSGDKSQLKAAFHNFCTNAIQAMAYGGEISILTENVDLDETYCRYSPFKLKPGHYLSIEFKDRGEGIPQENLKKIFEPFFTTRSAGRGAGLGLASVYGTVEQHGGAVTVYSELGVGSSFHIYLPLSNDQVLLHTGDEPVVKGAGTILLVDDEEFIRITARVMLESLNYTVLVAENGREGLDIFRESELPIDLVILDMVMPVMDGMETFKEMKALSPDARILLSSGFAKEEDLESLRAMGLLGYVKKPYRRAELSRAVAEAINNKA